MSDFLGSSEIAARAQMMNMTTRLQEAEVNAEKVKNTSKDDYMKQIVKVSKDFESIFLGYMLKQMRKTVPPDPLFGDSQAKQIFYEMYDDETAKELAKAGGIGLAAVLTKQLSIYAPSKQPQEKTVTDIKI